MTKFALDIPARDLIITARSYERIATPPHPFARLIIRLITALILATLWHTTERITIGYSCATKALTRVLNNALWCAKKAAAVLTICAENLCQKMLYVSFPPIVAA